MNATDVEKLVNSTPVHTKYDKSTHTWVNTVGDNQDAFHSSQDRTEAVVAGKKHAVENDYTHIVHRKDGSTLFKMFHK